MEGLFVEMRGGKGRWRWEQTKLPIEEKEAVSESEGRAGRLAGRTVPILSGQRDARLVAQLEDACPHLRQRDGAAVVHVPQAKEEVELRFEVLGRCEVR